MRLASILEHWDDLVFIRNPVERLIVSLALEVVVPKTGFHGEEAGAKTSDSVFLESIQHVVNT